jgi:hypothetical protein
MVVSSFLHQQRNPSSVNRQVGPAFSIAFARPTKEENTGGTPRNCSTGAVELHPRPKIL